MCGVIPLAPVNFPVGGLGLYLVERTMLGCD